MLVLSFIMSLDFMQFQLPKSSSHSHIFLISKKNYLKILDKLCFCLLQCYAVPPTQLQLMHQPSTCTNKCVQQLIHSALQSILQKGAGDKLQLHSKMKHERTILETIGGYFKCNTYYLMVLGWLKRRMKERKKERKKERR